MLALATLAITQPLLSLLGDNPTFFTAHETSRGQLVWFAIAVALGPALVLGAVVAAADRLGESWARRTHLTVVAGLGFLFVIQVVDIVGGHWIIPTVIAIVAAVGLTVAYDRLEPVRSAASVLGATPLLFVSLFLFVSPTSDLVFPDDVAAVELDDLLDTDDLAPVDDTVDGEDAPSMEARLAERFPSVHVLILDELPMATLLDENGEIDRARYPNFARLDDTSHLYTNATTVGFTTERAVPAILTGQYASAPAPIYTQFPQNLYVLLGDIYDATESDPLVDLCPREICNGEPPTSIVELLAADTTATSTTAPTPTTTVAASIEEAPSEESGSFGRLVTDARVVFGHLATPDGLDIGLPEIGATWGDFGQDLTPDHDSIVVIPTTSTTAAPTTTTALDVSVGTAGDEIVGAEVDPEALAEVNRAFLESLRLNDLRVQDFRRDLDELRTGVAPQLAVIHALFPHVPWRLHANGEIYDDHRLPGYFTAWDDEPTTARAAMQRHLLQTQFTDQLIGDYLDRLDELGTLGDSLVIVTADHGISFVPGERSRAPGNNGAGIAGVPIFVKLPGQTIGETHDKPVETIDIVPTVAAVLDIEIPWSVDGHDLLGPEVDRNRRVLHPFAIDIPDPYLPARDAITKDMLSVFGNGTDGNLYAMAGLRERMTEDVSDLMAGRSGMCWTIERPSAIPDEKGHTGFVFGEIRSSRTERIPIALTVDGVLTGTAHSLDHEVPLRVYALGDPTLFAGAGIDDVALHEIVDGELKLIGRC